MLRQKLLLIILGCLIFSGICFGTNLSGETQTNIYYKLYKLEPLPKIHYSWGLTDILDAPDNRILYELARITHSLNVVGEYVNKARINKCVYTCARVNKTKPKILCSIGINFSPWHRKFDKKLPPTDRGPTYQAEVDFFRERLKLIQKWVGEANKKYMTDVKVSALLLDCERFYYKPTNEKWNKGMQEALDVIHKIGQTIFPQARIQWYGRGIRRPDGSRWMKTPYFTGKEIKSPLSCSLYTLPEFEAMRETYRKTCVLADELRIEEVTPYVSLACGYRRDIIKKLRWDFDWDYNIIYSHMIGAELNIKWYGDKPNIFAPYNRAKIVIFYPRPFDRRSQAWGKHFVAYVRGATGITNLEN